MHAKSSETRLPPFLFVLFAVLLWSTGGLFIKMTTILSLY